MLSQAEIDHYHDKGYVIPDFRLPEETLAEIRSAHDRLLAKHPEFRDYCSCLLQYDTGFLNFARQPAILDMVEQVLGPDFALWNSSFFAKPAGNGKRTPWHQDGEYWPIRPLATCTAWIAVDAATPENGCLRVISGSQRSAGCAAIGPSRRATSRSPRSCSHTSTTRPRRSTSSSRRARSRSTTCSCCTARRPTPRTVRAAA